MASNASLVIAASRLAAFFFAYPMGSFCLNASNEPHARSQVRLRVPPPHTRARIVSRLKGTNGDRLHVLLCAANYNLRWLLRMIVKKRLVFLIGLLLRHRAAK